MVWNLKHKKAEKLWTVTLGPEWSIFMSNTLTVTAFFTKTYDEKMLNTLMVQNGGIVQKILIKSYKNVNHPQIKRDVENDDARCHFVWKFAYWAAFQLNTNDIKKSLNVRFIMRHVYWPCTFGTLVNATRNKKKSGLPPKRA